MIILMSEIPGSELARINISEEQATQYCLTPGAHLIGPINAEALTKVSGLPPGFIHHIIYASGEPGQSGSYYLSGIDKDGVATVKADPPGEAAVINTLVRK
jgi:hypothetical protein